MTIASSGFNNNLDIAGTLYEGGLTVVSKGSITLNGVFANGNNRMGASLVNNVTGAVGGVSLLDTYMENNFEGNGAYGLTILTKGAVIVRGAAIDSNAGTGAMIDNSTGIGNVEITRTQVNGNTGGDVGQSALTVVSKGAITLNHVEANSNTHFGGATLTNTLALTPKPVTVLYSSFNSNLFAGGLTVNSKGLILLRDVMAVSNVGGVGGSIGVTLVNAGGPAASGVQVWGTEGIGSQFEANDGSGLSITSNGNIVVDGFRANSNGINPATHYGIQIQSVGPGSSSVSVNHGETNGNTGMGLLVSSNGNINLLSFAAGSNGRGGAYLDNSTAAAAKTIKAIDSEFSGNTNGHGLNARSRGVVTLQGVTANSNINLLPGGSPVSGVVVTNNFIGAAGVQVLFSGKQGNEFSKNDDSGLVINTNGPITLRNTAADQNGGTAGNGIGAHLSSASGAVSVYDSSFGGSAAGSASGTGLVVSTGGAILLDRVSAYDNVVGSGANLVNTVTSGTPGVTVTRSIFSNNGLYGLNVVSKGTITLNSVQATYQANNYGVYLQNTGAAANVIFNNTLGTNVFADNKGAVYIGTEGMVNIKGVDVDGDTAAYAVWIEKMGSSTGVTLSTIKVRFAQTGLRVVSRGNISATLIDTMDNAKVGAELTNVGSAGPKTVLVTRSRFNRNGEQGLYITSQGNITLNAVEASNNLYDNAMLDSCSIGVMGACTGSGTITLSNTLGRNLFNYSITGDGLNVISGSTITIKGVTAIGNHHSGLNLDNCVLNLGACSSSGALYVENVILNENELHGIEADSGTDITLTNVSALFNGTGGAGSGAYLNMTSPVSTVRNVIINGGAYVGNYDHGIIAMNIASGKLLVNHAAFYGNDVGGGPVNPNIATDAILGITP